jgi:hypothetical protein
MEIWWIDFLNFPRFSFMFPAEKSVKPIPICLQALELSNILAEQFCHVHHIRETSGFEVHDQRQNVV